MKAILCKQPGGPDDLTLETIPDPQAGTGPGSCEGRSGRT